VPNQRAPSCATMLHTKAGILGPNSDAHPHFTESNMA
jgi:hypothetical protein